MTRRSNKSLALDGKLFAVKRKPVPHEFVLDALASLSAETRPMFGCLAVYVGDKIVCVLRDKRDATADDDGMWLATTVEHHPSLRQDFPNLRSIRVLGKKVTGWQVLPAAAPDFEEAALRACEFIVAGDPRIGKVPASRRASGSRVKKTASRTKTSKPAQRPRKT
jgi:hypothetical protein